MGNASPSQKILQAARLKPSNSSIQIILHFTKTIALAQSVSAMDYPAQLVMLASATKLLIYQIDTAE